jgi:hypothetical protein
MKAAKKVAIVIFLIGFASVAHAQSIFKPLPKPTAKLKVNIVDTLTPGSNYTGFRFTGPTVLYAVTPNNISTSVLYTMVGVDYESDYWDPTAQKFYTNWAIGLQGGEGGELAPSSISAVTAIGLTFSFQKIGTFEAPFKITLGAIYNFQNKIVQPAVGPGIPLNN